MQRSPVANKSIHEEQSAEVGEPMDVIVDVVPTQRQVLEVLKLRGSGVRSCRGIEVGDLSTAPGGNQIQGSQLI